MKIKLSPVRMDKLLVASVDGDKITLNGELFDFGPLGEGESLPAGATDSPWIAGEVHRIDGEIHITLVLPHSVDANESVRFPWCYSEPQAVESGEVPMPEGYHD